ncbi:MAG: hypothetical protein K6G70_07145 [Bacteroidaceae bacterium]|nr:hypothetical protein [Bacteroidaceae bacterium]
MKKTFYLIGLAAGMALMAGLSAACTGENEYHTSKLYRPLPSTALYVYADQSLDSIAFTTTESFKITTSQSWCTIAEGFEELTNRYANTIVQCVVPIRLEANTTGVDRSCVINIEAGEYPISTTIYQTASLNITWPNLSYVSEWELPATATEAQLAFNTYDRWELSTKEGDWITIPADSVAGGRGPKTVTFTFTKNPAADRRDTLYLTSRGVTDTIPVVQLRPE